MSNPPESIDRSRNAGAFRSVLFAHQDGVALGMILSALGEKGVIDRLLEDKPLRIGELASGSRARPGYLNIALRCFASEGWLSASGLWGSPDLVLQLTQKGRIASRAFARYMRAADFVRDHLPVDRVSDLSWMMHERFRSLVDEAVVDWGLLDVQEEPWVRATLANCIDHLDGNLTVPLMTTLHQVGALAHDRLGAGTDESNLAEVVRLFGHLKWIDADTGIWTPRGREACRYARHYGLMGSYLPMMSHLSTLIFDKTGSAEHRPHQANEVETHVDRKLNVVASGAAHASYFRDTDAIFIDLFDKSPVGEQPQFIADMGCGDGTWLAHLYELIATRTRRGRELQRHPLLMVGADFNAASLDVTRERLDAAGVPSLVLLADISDPAAFAAALTERSINIRDGLHIRSFIDHNRRYLPPEGEVVAEEFAPTGTYVDQAGEVIPAAYVEQNLVEHLARWVPHVDKHGIVVLESHTVEPRIAARHIGQLHNIAFDTYHGYSHQYPVEFEVFMRTAEKAGLRASTHHQIRYPSRLPFVAISLNHFRVATEVDPIPRGAGDPQTPGSAPQWSPQGTEDLADGEALHRFLYENGNLQRPRRWASGATGVLIRLVLGSLRERIGEIRRGERDPVLRLVDYGTGTGMATIELIKACRELGVFEEAKALGIDLQLHLLDLPGGWFAKGHELLSSCEFVHFHSLRDQRSGAFRPLAEVLGADVADIIIASMVFHLVPQKAMAELARNIQTVLRADGELIWNTPDTGPPLRGARLFHEPNRRVRQAALAVIDDDNLLPDVLSKVPDSVLHRYAHLADALGPVREALTPERRADCQAQANRQILPKASQRDVLEAQLGTELEGETFCKTFEMRMQDTIDAILVPSNQRLLPEIDDAHTRALLSEMLMKYHVLPTIYAGPAATTYGFNLHWTFGVHRRR